MRTIGHDHEHPSHLMNAGEMMMPRTESPSYLRTDDIPGAQPNVNTHLARFENARAMRAKR